MLQPISLFIFRHFYLLAQELILSDMWPSCLVEDMTNELLEGQAGHYAFILRWVIVL